MNDIDNSAAEVLLVLMREDFANHRASYGCGEERLDEYLDKVRDRPIEDGPTLDGHGHPVVDFALLHLMGTPADRPRDKLRDRVPFSDKTIAKRVRPLLSGSPEYGERVKNPLHETPTRNWFGMSTSERKYLLHREKTLGYNYAR